MGICSQVLALLSDTGRRGQTLLSVPKHSQTSQDAVKTPPRRPRGLQDRSKTPQDDPKSTPKRPHVGTSGTSKNKQKPTVFDDFSRIQPLPFIFCSMLIRNGLKISSRSLQERSKIPQDVIRPPTWGQHGPNMDPTWGQHGVQEGSKIGPRGSNRSPEGVTSSDCSPTAQMDPTWTPNAPQMNPKLGSCWDHLGVVLGSSWGHLGVILGSSWGHLGVI